MTTIRVDFNDSERGNVVAFASTHTELGDEVLMKDSEGNTCKGEVVSVSDTLVWIEPNWDTWAEAPPTKSRSKKEVKENELVDKHDMKPGRGTKIPKSEGEDKE